MITKQYKIEGMHCVHCQEKVQNIALATPGVLKAQVDLPTKTLNMHINSEAFQLEMLTEELGFEGFKLIDE